MSTERTRKDGIAEAIGHGVAALFELAEDTAKAVRSSVRHELHSPFHVERIYTSDPIPEAVYVLIYKGRDVNYYSGWGAALAAKARLEDKYYAGQSMSLAYAISFTNTMKGGKDYEHKTR